MDDFRIIYMGTPEFAVPSLEILIRNNYNVVAVVTAPDKPKGRGQKIATSPVKDFALDHKIPVLQPTNLKSEDFIEVLRSYKAHLQIVVAFRMLPEVVWNMPLLGTFNLHASLLPQYRGAAPINWAIINGEKQTGLTTFLLKHEIDTGNIIFQEKEPVHEDDTAGTLYERLRHKGADLVLKTVRAIERGNFPQLAQHSEEEIKNAPKIFKQDCEISWDQPTKNIYDFIRGLSPYPAAWTMIKGQTCKIYSVAHTDKIANFLYPGEYKTDNKTFLHIRTADGMLAIRELQMQGKKRMSTEEFLRGNTL